MGICVESRPMSELAFVFAGFFVGLVVGLTGVGGGSLMTPILIFFFGIKPYLAVGTDLLFAAVTKAGDLNPTVVTKTLDGTYLVAGLIYGLVNVRTDGEKILCATLNEKDNTWQVKTLQSRF